MYSQKLVWKGQIPARGFHGQCIIETDRTEVSRPRESQHVFRPVLYIYGISSFPLSCHDVKADVSFYPKVINVKAYQKVNAKGYKEAVTKVC